MSQRIQFLEAKGLTSVEIDDAIRQASLSQQPRAPVQAYQGQPVYGPSPYQLAQPLPGQWDWRDYFVCYTRYILLHTDFSLDHCCCFWSSYICWSFVV